MSVQLYEKPDAIVVPSQALQTGPEGQYVYVIGEDWLASVRKITVQRSDGDRAIVSGADRRASGS